MQDPSYGVPQQLIQHVHLISSHAYPRLPHMGLDQAFHYLFEAPKIVKQVAPMSWQFLTPPQDGTVFLTWLAPRMGNAFPSDGYIWADQEEHILQDFGGYTVEIAIHSSGFRPSQDQLADHGRRRYRLVSKNPQVSANPPDPNLWLVHYSHSEPHKVIPVQHVQITPVHQVQIRERQWIEQQGTLERQDFMLHYRDKWPQVKMIGRGMQGAQMHGPGQYGPNAAPNMANPRFSGQYYQQQPDGAGPSPAKRQRQHPPAHMPGAAAPPAVQMAERDTSIEDEENMLMGDLLDQMTQRDISLTRYMQHHEWMEEAFSSPYATNSIVPIELGFGLMGELSGLTKGIFDTVSAEQEKAQTELSTSTKIEPSQVEDFEKRVNEHLDNGQAELRRMKDEHAKRMDSMRKSKALSRAERRLREAEWRPDGAEARQSDVESIIQEVEGLLGASIQSQKAATLLEKGGLKEKVRPPPQPVVESIPSATSGAPDGPQGSQANGALEPAGVTQAEYRQEQLASEQMSQQDSSVPEQAAQPARSIPSLDQTRQQQQQAIDDTTMGELPDVDGLENMDSLGEDSMLMDDIDFGVEEDNVDVENEGANQQSQQIGAVPPTQVVPVAGSSGQVGSSSVADAVNSSLGTSAPVVSSAASDLAANVGAGLGVSANTSASANTGIGPSTGARAGTVGAPSADTAINTTTAEQSELFNPSADNTFDDFGDDGLIDFEGGESLEDMGMDNSAFGDAFHGTETHGEEDITADIPEVDVGPAAGVGAAAEAVSGIDVGAVSDLGPVSAVGVEQASGGQGGSIGGGGGDDSIGGVDGGDDGAVA